MFQELLLLGVIMISLYLIYEEVMDCKECFSNYMASSTKCFSCEKQFPKGQEWRGQPSKCIDCEKELVKRHGPQAGIDGKQLKCLSCQ